MTAPNFGPWLSTIKLKKTERQAIAQYLTDTGFTFQDLVDSQNDICARWFTRDNIPECSDIACFRLQNAISNMTQIPEEAMTEAEEESSDIPEAKAAPPAPQAIEQPNTSPAMSLMSPLTTSRPTSYKDWDVEMVVHWIEQNEQMRKIKPDTNRKIIEFVRTKRIDGSMLDETLFKNHKDDLKLISLGGRHKFRKAIRNLVEGLLPENFASPDAPDAVLEEPPPPQGSPSTSVRSNSARTSYSPNDSSARLSVSVPSSPQPSISTQQSFPAQLMDDHKAVDPVVPYAESPVNAMPPPSFSQQPHQMAMPSQSFLSPMHEQPVQPPPPSAMSHAPLQSIPAPHVPVRRWLWFSDDGVLHPYDQEANREIEDAFNRQEKEVKLTRGPFFSRFAERYTVIFDHKIKVHRQRNNQSKEQREVIGSDHEMVKNFQYQEEAMAVSPYSATVPSGPMHYQYQQQPQHYSYGQ